MGIDILKPSNVFHPYVIEIAPGCMFSAKTEKLISRANELIHTGKYDLIALKPAIDTREDRRKFPLEWTKFKNSSEIFELAKYADGVFIDEAQFADGGLVQVVLDLRKIGKNIMIAGVDKDYEGKSFGSMKELIFYSDIKYSLKAICKKKKNGKESFCGEDAYFTQRIISSKKKILVGGEEAYEPRCFNHHILSGYKE